MHQTSSSLLQNSCIQSSVETEFFKETSIYYYLMYFRVESSLSEYSAKAARFDGSKGLKCKTLTRSVKPE